MGYWDVLYVFYMWEMWIFCSQRVDCSKYNRITVPQDVHVLMPGACVYVTLYGNRDFTNVIKNMDSEMEKLSCIICIYNHMSL